MNDKTIKIIKDHIDWLKDGEEEGSKCMQIAYALEELLESKQIAVPKKPVKKTSTILCFRSKENYMHDSVEKEIEAYHCPSCDSMLATQYTIELNKMKRNNVTMFCGNCGQAIDWKE